MIGIKEAIIPFCDVATEISYEENLLNATVKFIRNSDEFKVILDKNNGKIVIYSNGNERKFSSLISLIASKDFADTEALFEAQYRIFNRDISSNHFDPDNLIEPAGTIGTENLTLESFKNITKSSKNDSHLEIVLIDGPAGVGKTSLIKRLMWERCKQHKRGENVPPILHVINRGRGLATLSDFLARSTQSSGAKFTYLQVPILVRLGLIQVCIDGFDELADPAGYLDAWEALRQFFEETQCGGPFLLAGRDTFFDIQSFDSSIRSSKIKIKTTRVRLQPVSKEIATDYLKKSGWAIDELNKLEQNDYLTEDSYALRPYFLSVLSMIEEKTWTQIQKHKSGPKYFLIDAMVERESKLLQDTIKDTPDINFTNLFEHFLGEVALEMSATESSVLDIPYLELIAEAQLKGTISEKDLGRILTKVGSLAMLERDESSSKMRKFSHSEIFNYYLAKGLIREICDGHFSGAIRRGTIDLQAAHVVSDLIFSVSAEQFDTFALNLHNELRKSPYGRYGQNISSLCMTTLGRNVSGINRNYENLSIEETIFPSEPVSTVFSNSFFLRLDVRGSNAEQIKLLDDCIIETLVMDDATKFPYHENIKHVELHNFKKMKNVRNPDEIKEIFPDLSEKDVFRVASNSSRLLERICRVFLRQHWLKLDDEDPVAKSLLRDEDFDDVLQILRDHGRLDEDASFGAGGSPGRFVHVRRPINLIDKTRFQKDDEDIWQAVYALSDDKN